MRTIETRKNENPAAIEIMKKVYTTNEWEKTVISLKKALPIKIAREIRNLRKGESSFDLENYYSWKDIAHHIANKYPEFSEENHILSENQISGMLLCEASMLKLKETSDQGWL